MIAKLAELVVEQREMINKLLAKMDAKDETTEQAAKQTEEEFIALMKEINKEK